MASDHHPFRLLECLGVTVVEAPRPTPWPVLYVPSHQLLVVSPSADHETREQAADYVLSQLPWNWAAEEPA